jgi:hypothetical protein
MWRDRKVRLVDCIALKNSVKRSKKWEENYADFEAHNRRSVKGTKLYDWHKNQLSNSPTGLDHKIEKEIEVNEGSTMWRDRKRVLLIAF